MFRNKLWAVAFGAILFASCEEIGPTINFGEVQAEAGDTTYVVATVPAAQTRNVLLEEFTGVSCPNCPAGHAIVEGIKEDIGERLVAIGLYQEGNSLSRPIDKDGHKTTDDFRTAISDLIGANIYAGQTNALPSGGVDRVPAPTLLMDRAKWAGAVNARLNVPTRANLELTSSYSAENDTLTVKIKVTFTDTINRRVYLTAGVIQDSILDFQEKGSLILENYVHNHVLRGLITPFNDNGLELENNGSYERGRVFEKTIRVKLGEHLGSASQYLNPDYIVPEHSSVFAFLHYKDGDLKEVLQAAEVHMK